VHATISARPGSRTRFVLSSRRRKIESLFAALANLSAAVSPSRLGTASPASAAPLSAAPSSRLGEARATDTRWLRRSLRACTAEGLVAELISACAGGAILTGWAIYLHASPLVTGLVLALSQLAQLFQLPAAWTTQLLGRRRACILLVGASRQVTLPLVALPFLPISDAGRQGVLLAVAGLSAVLNVLGNNAWVSWMSDLVPKTLRGRYFGRRTALCTLGGALAAAAVGLLLDRAKAEAMTGGALAVLQVIACVCGVAATALMMQQHDPNPEHTQVPFAWARLVAPWRDPSARSLCTYLIAWNGAVGLAGSFFALHMLRNLKMSFTVVALHGTAVALVRMVAAPVWGGLLDRLGARPVLLACSFGIGTIPFIWLLPREDYLWPLLLDCVVAGVLWCGHGLAAFNLPLAITPRAERPFYLAVFSTVSGLSFSAATIAGGFVAQALPDHFALFGREFCDLHVLFVLSGVLRFAAAFAGLRVQEPAAKSVRALWPALVATLPTRRLPAPAALLRLGAAPANDNARGPVSAVARSEPTGEDPTSSALAS
jgi:MFS family permease